MVAPVTGPFTVVKSSGAAPRAWSYIQQVRKQAKPHNLLLPYSTERSRRISQGVGNVYDAGLYGGPYVSPISQSASGDPYYAFATSSQTVARNAAIGKFNRKQAARASVGIALAQAKQSISMIEKRLIQLTTAVRQLRRMEFGSLLKTLDLMTSAKQRKKSRRGYSRAYRNSAAFRRDFLKREGAIRRLSPRERSKALADLWLEISYGWMPAVDDIVTARGVLEEAPYYLEPIRAKGSHTRSWTATNVVNDGLWKRTYEGKHSFRATTVCGGMLTVTNPNWNLASRLGLTNLPMIIYEATPWSFVLNYFVNMEEWLLQFDQYYGVSVSGAWYTDIWVDDMVRKDSQQYNGGAVTVTTTYSAQTLSLTRSVGSLPTVTLGIRPSYYNGVKRAVNNVALLLQQLHRVKPR